MEIYSLVIYLPMLTFLDIRNFALVDHISLQFQEGLNLLTGETGSGKSIIVDALGLLRGSKAYSEMIRTGFERAIVSGLFKVAEPAPMRHLFEESGIEFDPEELIVKREITQTGRGRAFVNNQMVPVAFLRQLGKYFVDIHGQSDQQTLFSPEAQLRFLDLYANHQDLLRQVEQLYQRLEQRFDQVERLKKSEQERLQTIDLLSFQVADIEKMRLSSEVEEQQLQDEQRLLANADRLFQASHKAYSQLYEAENSVGAMLKQIGRLLEELEDLDGRCQPVQEQFQSARITIEDVALVLREYRSRVDVNPQRLDWIDDRLAGINRLKQKYGGSVKEVMSYLDKTRRELVELQKTERTVESLDQERADLQDEYLEKAKNLSRQRKLASERLEISMQDELEQLAMEKTCFQVAFLPSPGGRKEVEALEMNMRNRRGFDTIEFMISPNAGEDLKVLAKIASGGEISRIMLALKTIGAIDDRGKTLVFDEVDAGIGGQAADVVGRKLKRLSKFNQVLCVTHLPQIASYADHHFHIEKKVERGRTHTQVSPLNRESRVQEIARMMSGERVTSNVLKSADELLKSALN